MADGGVVQWLRILLDQEQAKATEAEAKVVGEKTAAALADRTGAKRSGNQVAKDLLDELQATFKQREAQIKEQVATGLLNPAGAKRAGAANAASYNAALSAGLKALRAGPGGTGGSMSDSTQMALQNSFKTAGAATSIMSKLQTAIMAAFAVERVYAFGKAVMQTTMETEVAWTRVSRTLANFGVSWDKVQGDLFARSQEMGAKFGITQKQYADTFQMLISMTGSYEKSIRGTQVALDLSVAKHMSVEMAARLVGRGIAGATTQMTRYGIVIDKNRDFLTQLSAQLTGEKAAAAETYAGKVKILGYWWNELQLSIGRAMEEAGGGTSILEVLISAVKGLSNWVQRNHKEFNDLGKQMVVFGHTATQVFNFLAPIIGKAVQGFQILAESIDYFGKVGHERLKFALGKMGEMLADFGRSALHFLLDGLPGGLGSSTADMLGDKLFGGIEKWATKYVGAATDKMKVLRENFEENVSAIQQGAEAVKNLPQTHGFGLGDEGEIHVGKKDGKAPKDTILAHDLQHLDVTKLLVAEQLKLAGLTKSDLGIWELHDKAMQDAIPILQHLEELQHSGLLSTTQQLEVERAIFELRNKMKLGYVPEDYKRRIKEAKGLLKSGGTVDEGAKALRDIDTELAAVDVSKIDPKAAQELKMQRDQIEELLKKFPLSAKPWLDDFRETFWDKLPDMAKGAGEGIVDHFDTAFQRIIKNSGQVKAALGDMARGMAAGVLSEIAKMALGKAAENVAWAFEETAKGLADLADPNPISQTLATLHFNAAAGFAASALKWGLVGGVAGAAANGASGGGGRNTGGHYAQSATPAGPAITFIVDGFAPGNPIHQDLLKQGIDEYQKRYGGTVTIRGRS